MSIACSAWSSVSFSPRTTWTTDCPCRWSLAKAAASAAVAMPRRGQYSRAADTPRAFRAWPVPCPRRQARLRLTMQHCGALAHGSGGSRSPMPLAARMTGQFNA